MPLLIIAGWSFLVVTFGLVTHKPAPGYDAGGWPKCGAKNYDSQAQRKSADACEKTPEFLALVARETAERAAEKSK